MDTHRRYRTSRCAWALVALLLACLATLPACKKKAVVANTTDPQWIEPRNTEARVAVVFIHGLFGDTLGTWRANPPPNETSFFTLLRAAPEVGDKVDLYAFGFTSDMFGTGSLNIREAANSLENKLDSAGVWNYDNVVFVAHSMGGLVTLRYLITHPEQRRKVPLVALYASPMDGAQIANIAQHVASNPALAQMLDSDANEFLATLNEDWLRIPERERPLVRCAYETAKTHGVMVVTRRSGTRYCTGNLLPIEGSDHIDIVKPDRPTHSSIEMLVNALKRDVFGTETAPRFDTPNFSVNAAGEWEYAYRADSLNNRATLRNIGNKDLEFHIGIPSGDTLVVTPRPTPRRLAANASETLEMYLVAPGNVRPEYTFTLKINPLGERTVRVKLDDVAAFTRMQIQATSIAAEGIQHFVDSNGTRLNTLSAEQQRAEIAEAARVALAERYPSLPEERQWLLTADALSRMPLDDVTTVALRNVERIAPEVAAAPAVTKFAASVSAQSGTRVFEQVPPTPPDATRFNEPDAGSITLPDEVRAWRTRDATRFEALAETLQTVSSQRQNGLVLQGDVLARQGQDAEAIAMYRDANRISQTPAIRQRIQQVSEP